MRGPYRQSEGKDKETFSIYKSPFLGPMKQFFSEPTHYSSIENPKDDLVTQSFPTPKSDSGAGIVSIHVFDEIQGQEEEWISQTVVGARLGHDDALEVFGYVLIGEATFDNGIRQNRICGCHTGANCKCVKKREPRYQGPGEQATTKPHPGHARTQQPCEAFPFEEKVLARQLDAGDDKLDPQDQAGKVKGDCSESVGRPAGIFQRSDQVCCQG